MAEYKRTRFETLLRMNGVAQREIGQAFEMAGIDKWKVELTTKNVNDILHLLGIKKSILGGYGR